MYKQVVEGEGQRERARGDDASFFPSCPSFSFAGDAVLKLKVLGRAIVQPASLIQRREGEGWWGLLFFVCAWAEGMTSVVLQNR